jgi:phosphoribosylformimino-5-aminoimidazole carboxamide ribotide isomerase
MIVIPAIDIRDGACVQLVGGSYEDERVRLPDPCAVARRWRDAGFTRLHVVDLDAATGAGSNAATLAAVLAERRDVQIQVGGGVRSEETMDALFAAGAARVVVGTRALEDLAWLAEQAKRWPRHIMVAVDVKSGKAAVRGWREAIQLDVCALLRELSPLPLAGILVTGVDVEGRLLGPDFALVEEVVRATRFPVTASGGVATLDDIRALRDLGAQGCVVGMALYTGALDPRVILEEFHS